MVNVTFVNTRPYAVNVSLEGPTNTAFNVAANGQTVQNVNAGVYPTVRFTSPNKVVTVDQLRLAAGSVVRIADYVNAAAEDDLSVFAGVNVTFVNDRPYNVNVSLHGPTNRDFIIAANGQSVQNVDAGVYDSITFTSPNRKVSVDSLRLGAGDVVRTSSYLPNVATVEDDEAPRPLWPAFSIKIVNDTRSAATVRLEADTAPMLQLAVGTNVDLRVIMAAETAFTVTLNGRSARVDVKDLRSSIVLHLTSIFPIALPAGTKVRIGDSEVHTSAIGAPAPVFGDEQGSYV